MSEKPRLHLTEKRISKKVEPEGSFIFKTRRNRKQKLGESSSSSISQKNKEMNTTRKIKQEFKCERDDREIDRRPMNSTSGIRKIKQEFKSERDDREIDRRPMNSTSGIRKIKQELKCKRDDTEVDHRPSKSFNYIKRKREKTLRNSHKSVNIIRNNYRINKKVIVKQEEPEDELSSDEQMPEDDIYNESSHNKQIFRRIGYPSEGLVECTLCFKQLKEMSMKQHFRTHSGVKPYPCGVCRARFTRRGDAIRHRKTIHPNSKPFECCMCSKRFLERKSLIFHLQNHDKTVFYTCPTCGFKFGKKHYYENHVWYIHPLPKGESLSSAQDIVGKGAQQLKMLLDEETESDKKLGDDSVDESLSDEKQDMETTELVHSLKSEGVASDFHIKEEESCHEESYSPGDGSCAPGDESCDDPAEEDFENNVNNVKVQKGTLSITQRLLNQGDVNEEEELLVQQAISAAVSQAEAALQNIQCTVGNNMSSQSVYNKVILNNNNNALVSKEVKKIDPNSSEIHINATVRGHPRKYIIELPSSLIIDASTQEGMDTIVKLVNYLCSGKELSGPVEVALHRPL